MSTDWVSKDYIPWEQFKEWANKEANLGKFELYVKDGEPLYKDEHFAIKAHYYTNNENNKIYCYVWCYKTPIGGTLFEVYGINQGKEDYILRQIEHKFSTILVFPN